MIFKQLKKLSLLALASLVALPMAGQDLLANQAPIDRKMKAVDSLMMQQLRQYSMLLTGHHVLSINTAMPVFSLATVTKLISSQPTSLCRRSMTVNLDSLHIPHSFKVREG